MALSDTIAAQLADLTTTIQTLDQRYQEERKKLVTKMQLLRSAATLIASQPQIQTLIDALGIDIPKA